MLFFFFFCYSYCYFFFFFFQAEDGIRDTSVTGVQTCALPIYRCSTEGAAWPEATPTLAPAATMAPATPIPRTLVFMMAGAAPGSMAAAVFIKIGRASCRERV